MLTVTYIFFFQHLINYNLSSDGFYHFHSSSVIWIDCQIFCINILCLFTLDLVNGFQEKYIYYNRSCQY
jgi:hypothetical protein